MTKELDSDEPEHVSPGFITEGPDGKTYYGPEEAIAGALGLIERHLKVLAYLSTRFAEKYQVVESGSEIIKAIYDTEEPGEDEPV